MKRSLYIFLCSLMGILLFLIIHRLLMFGYMMLVWVNPELFAGRMTYLELVVIDLFTLFLAIMLGAWYGIWLGLKWYDEVYVHRVHGGFVDHLVKNYWPSSKKTYDLKHKIETVTEELKEEVLELENLTKTIKPVLKEAEPVKKRVVRKRVIKSKTPAE